MPVERQVKKYRQRFGVNFTTTTFNNWIIRASELRLSPLIERLSSIQMNSGYICRERSEEMPSYNKKML
ncbi:MAG: transposase [Sulfurimonas sp.]|nr:transposase [Sulfurimonas sp.]